jgi:hypothetical protein
MTRLATCTALALVLVGCSPSQHFNIAVIFADPGALSHFIHVVALLFPSACLRRELDSHRDTSMCRVRRTLPAESLDTQTARETTQLFRFISIASRFRFRKSVERQLQRFNSLG